MRSIATLAVAALAAFALPAPAEAGGSSITVTYGAPGYHTSVARGYVFGAPRYGHHYHRRHYHRWSFGAHRHHWRGNALHHHHRHGNLVPRLSVRRVIHRLGRFDFTHASKVRLFGDVYRVRARDAYGRRVGRAVDAYTGDILSLRTRR